MEGEEKPSINTRKDSSISSNSSISEDSSDSSREQKKKAASGPGNVQEQKASKASRSRSRSKERQALRSNSASVSPDNDYRKTRERKSDAEKAVRYETKGFDKKRDSYRGSPNARRRIGGKTQYVSRSPSRSPDRGGKRDMSRGKRKLKVFVPGLDGHLISFRQFMQLQPEKLDSKKAESIYNRYKKEYEEKQAQIFFQEHENDQWMLEKYHPLLSQKLRNKRIEESRASAQRFFQDLKSGVYEKLNLDITAYNPKLLQNLKSEKPAQMEDEPTGENKPVSEIVDIVLDEDVNITREPFFGFDPNSLTLFIKSIPKFISRWDLEEELSKFTGFVSLSLSEPLKSQEFIRLGWILFDTEDHCNKAYELLNNLVIKEYHFQIVKSKSQKKPVKVCTLLTKKKNDENIELSRQLIQVLDSEKKIESNPLLKLKCDPSKQIDLHVLYLRKVHSYCFYSASEYHDERMMVAKCGPIFLRTKIGEEQTIPEFSDWHKKIQETVKQRIQESKSGETEDNDTEARIQQEMDKKIEKKARKLADSGKWPCKYCTKVFQDCFFVVKHIKGKHVEETEKIRQKALKPIMYDNYLKDKNKINPSMQGYSSTNQNSSRSQSRGHQNYHSQQPYGQHQRRHSRGGQYPPRGQKRDTEYKDLDEPKELPGKIFRTVVDYSDI